MKHPLAHRIFSGLLALLVLTTSVGLTVLRHTCRQSGHTSTAVVFSAPRHRCPAPMQSGVERAHSMKSAAQLKSACCDFQTHFHKLNTPSSDFAWVKSLVPPLVAAWLPSAEWPTAPLAPLALAAKRWHAADSSPPPRAGRALLVFVCTLVV